MDSIPLPKKLTPVVNFPEAILRFSQCEKSALSTSRVVSKKPVTCRFSILDTALFLKLTKIS